MSYLLVFSSIPHKETRFLLPIFPLCFLMMGDFSHKLMKKFSKNEKQICFVLTVCVVYEAILSFAFYQYRDLRYKPVFDIMTYDDNPH
jgi:hypothetical protein